MQDSIREKRGHIGTNYDRNGKMLPSTELIKIVTKTWTMILRGEEGQRQSHVLSVLKKEVCMCMWGRGDINHHRNKEEIRKKYKGQ